MSGTEYCFSAAAIAMSPKLIPFNYRNLPAMPIGLCWMERRVVQADVSVVLALLPVLDMAVSALAV